jgi:deoxyribonuclease-4
MKMADRPRFGPAGTPPAFKLLKGLTTADLPKFLHEEGLDAFEYQASRWGPTPQIRREEAEKLGENARKWDVWLTVHGSYFINFGGDEKTVEASKKRLLACVTGAHWMGAHVVVFHPGFYEKKSPQQTLKNCMEAMKNVLEEMQRLGITKVNLGPETMGKHSQLGSLDEVLTLCEQLEQTEPIIDWAHIHARGKGRLKTVDDFNKVLEEIEKRLGSNAVKNLHCHYTAVEYTEKGEKCHHTLEEKEFGPNFQFLAKLIAELNLNPVIISESPVLDVDALKMRDIVMEEIRLKGI